MRRSLAIVAAVAGTASAESVTALTFWNPGPALNPSIASKYGESLETYPPVASIISSDAATTIFTLGCPATATRIPDGSTFLTCNWATDQATYTLINGTRNVMHRTNTMPDASMWWTCDSNPVATQVTCALEVSGDVNDNTGGPISDWVIPDRAGNVVAFATAQIVTEGRFGELDCGIGYASSSARKCNSDGTGGKPSGGSSAGSPTALLTETGAAPSPTATQGSGIRSSAPTRTVSTSASASASVATATASTGAAARYGVEGVALAVLAGAAALNI